MLARTAVRPHAEIRRRFDPAVEARQLVERGRPASRASRSRLRSAPGCSSAQARQDLLANQPALRVAHSTASVRNSSSRHGSTPPVSSRHTVEQRTHDAVLTPRLDPFAGAARDEPVENRLDLVRSGVPRCPQPVGRERVAELRANRPRSPAGASTDFCAETAPRRNGRRRRSSARAGRDSRAAPRRDSRAPSARARDRTSPAPPEGEAGHVPTRRISSCCRMNSRRCLAAQTQGRQPGISGLPGQRRYFPHGDVLPGVAPPSGGTAGGRVDAGAGGGPPRGGELPDVLREQARRAVDTLLEGRDEGSRAPSKISITCWSHTPSCTTASSASASSTTRSNLCK